MSVTRRIYDGSMYDKPIPRCGNCGETFEDLAGTARADLPACPNCGTTDQWGYHFSLRAEGEVTRTGEAQVIPVGWFAPRLLHPFEVPLGEAQLFLGAVHTVLLPGSCQIGRSDREVAHNSH